VIGGEAAHFIRYRLNLDKARSLTTDAEQRCLAQYAKGKTRAVEIGIFEGASARAICGALARDGVLYAVDPFPTGRLGVSWAFMIARREVPSPPARFVRMNSADAANYLTGLFDFMFIDGDHLLDGFRRDWIAWSRMVETNGMICLHDTVIAPHSSERLGTHEYFDAIVRHDPRFEIVAQVDALSVLRRK
jgi:predicted O-methyltransferase YrrM